MNVPKSTCLFDMDELDRAQPALTQFHQPRTCSSQRPAPTDRDADLYLSGIRQRRIDGVLAYFRKRHSFGLSYSFAFGGSHTWGSSKSSLRDFDRDDFGDDEFLDFLFPHAYRIQEDDHNEPYVVYLHDRVLEESLHSLQINFSLSSHRAFAYAFESLEWFFTDEVDGTPASQIPFSFVNCALACGLDKERLRARLLQLQPVRRLIEMLGYKLPPQERVYLHRPSDDDEKHVPMYFGPVLRDWNRREKKYAFLFED